MWNPEYGAQGARGQDGDVERVARRKRRRNLSASAFGGQHMKSISDIISWDGVLQCQWVCVWVTGQGSEGNQANVECWQPVNIQILIPSCPRFHRKFAQILHTILARKRREENIFGKKINKFIWAT